MNEYKAMEMVTIQSGNVILDQDQYRRRAHCVEDNNDGTFSVVKPIQFKKGELFSSDMEVNKLLALSISDTAEQESIPEPEPTPEPDYGSSDDIETHADDEIDEINYEAMNRDTLKLELDHRHIEYLVNDTKTALIRLLDQDDVS